MFSHLNLITNPTPLPNATLTIGATARNPNYRGSRVYPNYRGSRTQPKLSGPPHATLTSGLPHATLTVGAAGRGLVGAGGELGLRPRGSRCALVTRASFYFALQKKISIKSNHQPQYMHYHYTNKLPEIPNFFKYLYCWNIYTVINERRKITGKFAPILEQWWEGQTKGANLPAGKKKRFSILVVFCSYLEYNAITPFRSHVLYRFLHTYFFSCTEVLSM